MGFTPRNTDTRRRHTVERMGRAPDPVGIGHLHVQAQPFDRRIGSAYPNSIAFDVPTRQFYPHGCCFLVHPSVKTRHNGPRSGVEKALLTPSTHHNSMQIQGSMDSTWRIGLPTRLACSRERPAAPHVGSNGLSPDPSGSSRRHAPRIGPTAPGRPLPAHGRPAISSNRVHPQPSHNRTALAATKGLKEEDLQKSSEHRGQERGVGAPAGTADGEPPGQAVVGLGE